MKTRITTTRIALRTRNILAAALGACFLVTPTHATPPNIMQYQGRLSVDGQNYHGTGHFKFRIIGEVNGMDWGWWGNSGMDLVPVDDEALEPATTVEVPVKNGHYSIGLGDTSLPGMAIEMEPASFANSSFTKLRLRVWFSQTGEAGSFEQITPDHRITSTAYALAAGYADQASTVAAGAVDADKIAVGAVNSEKIASGAVESTHIADGTITSADLHSELLENLTTLWSQDGSDIYRVSGRVGIGTVNPSERLQIGAFNESSDTFLSMKTNGGSLYRTGITLRASTEVYGFTIEHDDRTAAQGGTLGLNIIRHENSEEGESALFIDRRTGNVGIGTTTPKTIGTQPYPAGWTGLHVRSANHGLGIIEGATGARLHLRNSSNSPHGRNFAIVHSDQEEAVRMWWLDPNLAPRLEVMKIDTFGNVFIPADLSAKAVSITSDRDAKSGFTPVDSREVLEKVAALPITRWHYKNDQEVPHIGPMAQDFHAAFATGKDDKHITTVDADGVALAAIQGLKEIIDEKDAEIEQLRDRLAEMQVVGVQVQRRLEAVEASLSAKNTN